MYDCLICEMMIKLLQWIDWLQWKICKEWTLNFENSKFWSTHYEIKIKMMIQYLSMNANSDQKRTTSSFQRQSMSWFTLQESLSDSIWMST